MTTKRIAVFIDGPNVYATSKALGIDVDYKRLLNYYGDNLVRVYYYTAIIEGEEYTSIRPLIDWLGYNGYSVVTKPAKQFVDPLTGRTKTKGNMDCELTVDALELAGSITDAVFFTGDGDFKALLMAMQRRGVRNTVVSSIETKPPMCADELRRVADTFIDLAVMVKDIGRGVVDKPRSKYG